MRRFQKLPDPRDLTNGSAAILNFQNGRHDHRLEARIIVSTAFTSMKFGIKGYFGVLSSKIAGSKRSDQRVGRHLEFQNGHHDDRLKPRY